MKVWRLVYICKSVFSCHQQDHQEDIQLVEVDMEEAMVVDILSNTGDEVRNYVTSQSYA